MYNVKALFPHLLAPSPHIRYSPYHAPPRSPALHPQVRSLNISFLLSSSEWTSLLAELVSPSDPPASRGAERTWFVVAVLAVAALVVTLLRWRVCIGYWTGEKGGDDGYVWGNWVNRLGRMVEREDVKREIRWLLTC